MLIITTLTLLRHRVAVYGGGGGGVGHNISTAQAEKDYLQSNKVMPPREIPKIDTNVRGIVLCRSTRSQIY